MPRYPAAMTREDWQIVRRESGFYLQHREPDGAWRDVKGPYRGRHSALEWYRRRELYWLIDQRHDIGHVHRFAQPGDVAPAWARRCLDCGLMIDE